MVELGKTLSLYRSYARSTFSAKPVLNVNHDAHDVAENMQLESPLKMELLLSNPRREYMQHTLQLGGMHWIP